MGKDAAVELSWGNKGKKRVMKTDGGYLPAPSDAEAR